MFLEFNFVIGIVVENVFFDYIIVFWGVVENICVVLLLILCLFVVNIF